MSQYEEDALDFMDKVLEDTLKPYANLLIRAKHLRQGWKDGKFSKEEFEEERNAIAIRLQWLKDAK